MDEAIEQLEVAPAPAETANEDERQLIAAFKRTKAEVNMLEAELKEATAELEKINDKLIALLEADEKKSSARYNGLGHVTIVEGKVLASISKGMQNDVLAYLKTIGREDMIKTVVHSATLTAFVNQCLKQNDPLPPGVTHYRPKWINFYPAK